MRAAGFEEVEAEGHTFATAELTADAYGGAAIPVVEKYVAGHEAIGPDEATAWAAEQRELGQRGEFYFACVQLCFTGSRPSLAAAPLRLALLREGLHSLAEVLRCEARFAQLHELALELGG